MKALIVGALLILAACAGPNSSQPNGDPNTTNPNPLATSTTVQLNTQASTTSAVIHQPTTTSSAGTTSNTSTSSTTVLRSDTSTTTVNSTTSSSTLITTTTTKPLAPEPAKAEPTTTTTKTTEPLIPANTPWPLDPRTTHDRTWTVQIIDRWPHSTNAFTQGLETHDGTMYESTGLYGQSQLRALNDSTELRSVSLEPSLFGEGLTIVGDEIIQLTWQSGRALRWQRDTFEPIGEFTYEGEGWGICWDTLSQRLIMSDGTSTLTHRDSGSFAILATVKVRRNNDDIERINELECVAGLVVANIWQTNELIIIEPNNGEVLVTIDASLLAKEANIAAGETHAVLNGIAYQGNGNWVLGGKNWPTQFLVTFTLEG